MIHSIGFFGSKQAATPTLIALIYYTVLFITQKVIATTCCINPNQNKTVDVAARLE
jgi:hypothetical protein